MSKEKILIVDDEISIIKLVHIYLEKDQPKIFERFYQVDKSRKGGEGRGVGLGLAITKQMIISHGGEIWVESDGRNGTTFMVKLPLENQK